MACRTQPKRFNWRRQVSREAGFSTCVEVRQYFVICLARQLKKLGIKKVCLGEYRHTSRPSAERCARHTGSLARPVRFG